MSRVGLDRLFRLAACAALWACVDTPRDAGEPATIRAGDVEIALGPRETLLADGAFGLRFFPDSNVLPVGRDPLRVLLTATTSTWMVEGRDLRTLSRAREVLTPGGPGSFDNGYAGVGGVHVAPDGRLFAFYHAEDHEDMPRLPADIPGFHASVGVAVSEDGGYRFEKLGPVLTGARPKHFQSYPGQGTGGVGIPSTATSRDGRHLLLYYTEFSQVDDAGEQRGPQIGLARAPLDGKAPGPGRFRKHHRGAFSEPGLGGEDTPVLSAWHLDQSAAVQPHVLFSPHLSRYVMVLCVDYWKERQAEPERPGHTSGVYAAFSEDGIDWDGPHRLFTDWCYPELGGSVSWEPSLVPDDERAASGWLVYGYSERWGGTRSAVPHYMAGRRIGLARRPERSPEARR